MWLFWKENEIDLSLLLEITTMVDTLSLSFSCIKQLWIKVCLQYISDCHIIMYPWKKSYDQTEIFSSIEYGSLSFFRKLIVKFQLQSIFIIIKMLSILQTFQMKEEIKCYCNFGHNGYNGINIQIRKKNRFYRCNDDSNP